MKTVCNVLICEDGSIVETYTDGAEQKITAEQTRRLIEFDAMNLICRQLSIGAGKYRLDRTVKLDGPSLIH